MTRKRDELLEHDADGIREFDNDLPRWWLYGFYFTIVVAVLYMLNYHVLPSPMVGHGSIAAEYSADVAAAAALKPVRPAPSASGLVALTDEDSLARGKAIFESQTHPCAACHKPDLGGLIGPNLTDGHWLHGCGVSEVVETVRVGFPARGMLAYGGGPPLSDPELLQLASYILSRVDSNPPNAKAKDPERDVECR